MPQKQLPDFPPTADLCTEIFRPLPVVSDLPVEASKDWLAGVCGQVLSALHKSLETSSAKGLADVFVDDGAYWRDSLAFTYHLRTFSGRDAIAAALAELNPQRKSRDFEVVAGSAAVVAGGPSLVSAKSVRSSPLSCRVRRRVCVEDCALLTAFRGGSRAVSHSVQDRQVPDVLGECCLSRSVATTVRAIGRSGCFAHGSSTLMISCPMRAGSRRPR